MIAMASDSGSNNLTLGVELKHQLHEHDSTSHWNSTTMHIFCVCHKTGLIVHAGLDALGISPKRHRHAALLNFPNLDAMECVAEEDEGEIVIDIDLAETQKSNDESEDDDQDHGIGNLLDSDDNVNEEAQDEPPTPDVDDEEDVEDPEPPQEAIGRLKKGLPRTRMARLIRNVSLTFTVIIISFSFLLLTCFFS